MAAFLMAGSPVLAAEVPGGAGQVNALELPVLGAVRPLQVGIEAPRFQLPDLDGGRVELEKARNGRVLLLLFWSAFDAGSRPLIAAAEALAQRYRSAGLAVLGIATDGEVMKRSLQRTVRSLRLSYPVCLDVPGADETLAVAFAYGVRATPTAYVLDRKGRVAWVGEGYREDGALEGALRTALAAEAAE